MSGFASELHPLVDPFAERVCVGCGCTDNTACVDERGEACAWVEDFILDGERVDICSECVRFGLEVLAETGGKVPEGGAALVELASDYEADLFIRERRKTAGA